jgi:aminopeptidase N
MDRHSHSRPDQVAVRHIELDLRLDFERREVLGVARLEVERKDRRAPLVLDAQGLVVEAVSGIDGAPRRFRLEPERDGLGAPLVVDLEPQDDAVRVAWRTTERSDALQWLEPAQTGDGTAPFLYTQGQAILTRTWIPLQDSPGVRVTWEARVEAPPGIEVVMSAERRWRDADGAFRFELSRPVPAYLVALAAGRIEFRPVSDRAGVWAEPGMLERAHAEFSDMEAMVAAAERLFGAYRWGRYDLIVLPPSFPFGGMENPCMTFATPTVVAGDKSLVSLVAHELAHSWSGNLVTNATWRDFWLNEGFTVYFEHRIMEEIYGLERAQMERALARGELERELAELAPRDTVLHIDLDGRHPDEGFSGVPYVKGCLFLMRIEEIVGRRRFDQFLREWFDEQAFTSTTTEALLGRLRSRLLSRDELARIDLEQWIRGPGLPADAPRPVSPAFSSVDAAARTLLESRDAARVDAAGWTTQQWLRFLEAIERGADAALLEALEGRHALLQSGNSEILAAWLRLGVRAGWGRSEEPLQRFLLSVGRRKFLKPLYAELLERPGGRERALAIYAQARPRYHAVATGTLDELLGWKP